MGLQGITITGGYFAVGSAILLYEMQAPEIDNCIFLNNVATTQGGAVHSMEGRPRFTNCQFINNQAVQGGAIALLIHSWIELQGCVFSGNEAQDGGALFCMNADSTSISNCTFAQNKADLGANICLVSNMTGSIVVDHSIFAFGLDGEGAYWDGQGTLDFSCVDIFGNEGGDWDGAISDQAQANGNLHLNPLFCGDANLGSPFSLAANSPCAEVNNHQCGTIGALPVGCSEISGTGNPPLVSDFLFQPCYPNPFNPSTTLSFELKKDSEATLVIFDADGCLVRSLVAGYFQVGTHSIVWRGDDNQARPRWQRGLFCSVKYWSAERGAEDGFIEIIPKHPMDHHPLRCHYCGSQ